MVTVIAPSGESESEFPKSGALGRVVWLASWLTVCLSVGLVQTHQENITPVSHHLIILINVNIAIWAAADREHWSRAVKG